MQSIESGVETTSGASLPEPGPSHWLDVSHKFQLSDGAARCLRIAVSNDRGEPSRSFRQGERVHFYFEFEVLRTIRMPTGGAEILTEAGVVVHGKTTYQSGVVPPEEVSPGTRLRFHQTMELWVAPGRYGFNVGLVGVDPDAYRQYLAGDVPYEELAQRIQDHCRLPDAGSFEVGSGPGGRLSHHGLADLPGAVVLCAVEPAPAWSTPAAPSTKAGSPTVFHITHWKAGSQWIYKILQECVPDRIVEPRLGEVQVRHYPIQQGFVYPTVYLPKAEFDRVGIPENSRWFVVIRDLRDTLVSAYFSFKISHPVLDDGFAVLRQKLWDLDQEEGLLYLLDHFLEECARIQLSWLEAGEPLLKYEDLLVRDVELLEAVLIDRCGLPVSRERLREVVLANRFEVQTGGRSRGVEDVTAHQRKATPGDWRNHFTERVKRAFKARYGGLLAATGYEVDLNW